MMARILVAALLSSCYEGVLVEPENPEQIGSFELTVSGEIGTVDSPLENGVNQRRSIQLAIQAYGPDGEPSDYSGEVTVTSSEPCVQLEKDDGSFGATLASTLNSGRAEFALDIVNIPGPMELWVTADSRQGGGFAASISPTLHYARPTIAALQALPPERCDDLNDRDRSNCQRARIAHAALEGCAVQVDTGDGLVVTRVAGDGFNVSSRGKPVRDNSIFVYTYNAPEEVFLGAIIDELEGSATEFMGGSQLADTSYSLRRNEEGEAIGLSLEALGDEFPAVLLRAEDLNRSPANGQLCRRINRDLALNLAMERLEGAPVALSGPEIAYEPDAYSLSSYLEYGQFSISLNEGEARRCISLISRSALPNLDPRRPGCAGERIAYVEGTLRGLFFEGSSTPTWIIEAYNIQLDGPSPCLSESP